MGTCLFIYTGEDDRFDLESVRAMLDDIPGVYGIKDPDELDSSFSLLHWDYEIIGQETWADLMSELTAIVTDSLGDADLQLAIEIRKRWPRPLSVFDQGYSFHFDFEGINTVEEFWRRIDEEEANPD